MSEEEYDLTITLDPTKRYSIGVYDAVTIHGNNDITVEVMRSYGGKIEKFLIPASVAKGLAKILAKELLNIG